MCKFLKAEILPQVDTLLLKESARYLFNKISQRNLVAWNSSNGTNDPLCKAPSNFPNFY